MSARSPTAYGARWSAAGRRPSSPSSWPAPRSAAAPRSARSRRCSRRATLRRRRSSRASPTRKTGTSPWPARSGLDQRRGLGGRRHGIVDLEVALRVDAQAERELSDLLVLAGGRLFGAGDEDLVRSEVLLVEVIGAVV